MLSLGNGYIQSLAADESDGSLAGLRERAFAIYLLTRQGNVTTNALSSVEKALDERHAKTWRSDVTAAWLGASLKLMREDKDGAKLVAGPEKVLARHAEEAAFKLERFHDPLLMDSVTLYLLSKHFPERAKALSTDALENIMRPLRKSWYNSLSSAVTILALEAYAGNGGSLPERALELAAVGADGKPAPFGAAEGQVQRGKFDGSAQALIVRNTLDQTAWYSLATAGYARAVPAGELKEGFEVQREYRDAKGKAVTTAGLGDELEVHLRVRATRPDGVNYVALVDLLPGGFEPVQEPSPAPEAEAVEQPSPTPDTRSTWIPDYAEMRDDRVVVYGHIGPDLREYVYRIKATNAGTFQIPPAYGEGMYDRTIVARSGGGRMTVERGEPAK
jgi:uncharacterized protein YfaS (alpha-2-macroglobulin family)